MEQMNQDRQLASIFQQGPIFGRSPAQRQKDFVAFTADTTSTLLGPSLSAGSGSASTPIDVDVDSKETSQSAGGAGLGMLEDTHQLPKVNLFVLILNVSWRGLFRRRWFNKKSDGNKKGW